MLTTRVILAMLRLKQGPQSLRSYAAEIGCSVAYLSDIFLKRRLPGPKVLEYLKIKRQVKIIRRISYTREKPSTTPDLSQGFPPRRRNHEHHHAIKVVGQTQAFDR